MVVLLLSFKERKDRGLSLFHSGVLSRSLMGRGYPKVEYHIFVLYLYVLLLSMRVKTPSPRSQRNEKIWARDRDTLLVPHN